MNQHFITKTHIEHVRHLKEIDIPLSQESCKHIILTGKNGSGKASVMVEKYNRKKIKWFEKRITVRLKRNSTFAAFKRSYIRNHSVEYAELQEYVAL